MGIVMDVNTTKPRINTVHTFLNRSPSENRGATKNLPLGRTNTPDWTDLTNVLCLRLPLSDRILVNVAYIPVPSRASVVPRRAFDRLPAVLNAATAFICSAIFPANRSFSCWESTFNVDVLVGSVAVKLSFLPLIGLSVVEFFAIISIALDEAALSEMGILGAVGGGKSGMGFDQKLRRAALHVLVLILVLGFILSSTSQPPWPIVVARLWTQL